MRQNPSPSGTISDLCVLGPQAVGRITPVGEGADSLPQRIREIVDRAYTPTTETVAASCIDGRSAEEGSGDPSLKAPDVAGGTLAFWIAFVLNGCDLPLETFLTALRSAGIPIGGHTDEHAHSGASGCGANDRLGHILELIGTESSCARIVALTQELGVPVGRDCAVRLSKRADELSGSSLLATPVQRLALIEAYGDLITLCGKHTEQLIVVNTVPGTTLDRHELRRRLGEQAAVFNLDLWAFSGSLRQTSAALSKDDAVSRKAVTFEHLLIALLFYNLATALVLCAPSMRMVLRSA